MEFHRDSSNEINVVRALGDDGLRVGAKHLTAPCVVTPQRIIEYWPVASASELRAAHFDPFINDSPELILFGSGQVLEFPAPDVAQALAGRGIGFEVMDTAAACRTYNVLAHEGRAVVAALIVAA